MTPRGPGRRHAVVLAVLALTVLAGCNTATGPTDPTTETPTTTNSSTLQFPDPPESLTPEAAADTARQYHLTLLAQRLAGTGTEPSGSLPPRTAVNSTVIDRAEGGFYVALEVAEEGVTSQAPRFSRAMYLLREGTDPRSAFPLPPSETTTFYGDGNPVEPVDVRVANFGPVDAEVTVVVTQLSDPAATAALERVQVPSRTGLVLEDAIGTAGRYRVTVTSGDRSTSRTLDLTGENTTRTIGIYVDPDGTLNIPRNSA